MSLSSNAWRALGFVCLLVYPISALIYGFAEGRAVIVVSGGLGLAGVTAFLLASRKEAGRIIALQALLDAEQQLVRAKDDRIAAQAGLIHELRKREKH